MIVSGYSMDLLRNIHGYKYADMLTDGEKEMLRDYMVDGIAKLELPLRYIPSYKNAMDEVDYMKENFLLSMDVTVGKDPAILYATDPPITFMLNDMDHMLISMSTDTGDVEALYERVKKISDQLEEIFPFQRDRTFQYLSSSIPLCGNGLVIDSMVHIPALMSQNKVVNAAQKTMKYTGGMLLPFNQVSRPNAFFIVRVISKGNIAEDIRFAKNMVEELTVMEEAEVTSLRENPDFLSFLKEHIRDYQIKDRVYFPIFFVP